MATQINNPQAIVPEVPRDPQIIDKTTGQISTPWNLFFQQLVLALQTTLSNEGIVIPHLPATSIAQLGNTNQSVGSIIYDDTNNLFKGILLVTPGTPTVPPVTITRTFTLT